MDDIKNIVEKLKKEMKKDKDGMLNVAGVGVISKDVCMPFIRDKYIRLLVNDKKINAAIIRIFVNNLLSKLINTFNIKIKIKKELVK